MKTMVGMNTLINMLYLLLTIVLICSPLYLVYAGIVLNTNHFWIKLVLVVVGLILCRMVKPISVLSGKDLKVF
jgi:hypothetical protein